MKSILAAVALFALAFHALCAEPDYSAHVAQDYRQYFEQNPTLQDGGGQIFANGESWVAIAVGTAPLDSGASSDKEVEARKVAKSHAVTNMTETIFGSTMTVEDSEKTTVTESTARARIAQWVRKTSKEEIRGRIAQAEMAGTWIDAKKELLVVVLAISGSGSGRSTPKSTPIVKQADPAVLPPLCKDHIPQEWQESFARHPQILGTGAAAVLLEGTWHIIAVGSAKLSGDPAKDRIQAPLVSEVNAKKHIIQYVLGIRNTTVKTACEETFTEEEKQSFAQFEESFKSITTEQASGGVRSLLKLGEWKSTDGKTLFSAHAVSLTDVIKP